MTFIGLNTLTSSLLNEKLFKSNILKDEVRLMRLGSAIAIMRAQTTLLFKYKLLKFNLKTIIE